MIPRSLRNKNIHKGPSSSAEFNQIRNDIHADITQLYSGFEEQEIQMKDNMDTLLTENFFLQNKVKELESELAAAKNTFINYTGNNKEQLMTHNYFSEQGVYSPNEETETFINNKYGTVSPMPGKIDFKLFHIGEDNVVSIPDDLIVTLYESHNNQPIDEASGEREYYIVDQKNLLNMFDGDPNTFFARHVTFPKEDHIHTVYGMIHIQVPIESSTNLFANQLHMIPFPSFSMTIRDIQVKGYDGSWRRLENYPLENGEPKEIEEIDETLFTFSKENIVEIKIYFSQPYGLEGKDMMEFRYGFQEVNLMHVEYHQDLCEFVTTFSIEETTKSFDVIYEPKVEKAFGSKEDVDDLISHELFYNASLTNEGVFGEQILADVQKVYIKTTIQREEERTPILTKMHLSYEQKDIYN